MNELIFGFEIGYNFNPISIFILMFEFVLKVLYKWSNLLIFFISISQEGS
jgi:hypothetical protein